MRVLAIETSSKSVSVAILDKGQLVFELDSRKKTPSDASELTRLAAGASNKRLAAGASDKMPQGFVRKRSKGGFKTSRVFPPGASVLLAPMIKSLLDSTQLSIQQVDLIAVSTGPGSFTGLRVGVVTAKALAYATDAHVIGVNTLEAIAAKTAMALGDNQHSIRPVLNAQRQQIFCGCFTASEDWVVKETQANQIMDREAWREQIEPSDVLTGSGLKQIMGLLDLNGLDAVVAPEDCWECTASDIGKLGWRQFQDGRRDSLWELDPFYFRPSTAEEVLEKKRNFVQGS